MTNGNDTCANCGGDRGIHHYQTDQCPVGGVESSVNERQEWKNSTFSAIPFDPPHRLAGSMSIREAFAMAAIQGLLANTGGSYGYAALAKEAVANADALITALNEESK